MMNKKNRVLVLIMFLLASVGVLQAQTDSISVGKYVFSLRLGYNVGGYSPLPIPQEIREIESYQITFNPAVELQVWRRFNKRWGCSVGLRYENKGMETSASVKNYQLTMKQSEDEVHGYFTGKISTKIYTSSLRVPINATYNLSPKWRLNAGVYAAYLLKSEFSGSANEGYLRHNTPIGIKTDITPDNPSTYDFSANMLKWDVGAQLGADWNLLPHFYVFADVNMGFFSTFDTDFDAITFPMFPIFGTIGISYHY